MDPVMLRNQALNIALMRAKKSDSLDDIKASAEGILDWLKKGGEAVNAGPASSTTHESQAAVEGQEPKGE